LQPEHYSSLTAPNLQHTASQERNDQYGNQHHSREPSSWFFYSSVITMMHGPINIRSSYVLLSVL